MLVNSEQSPCDEYISCDKRIRGLEDYGIRALRDHGITGLND